MESPYDQSISSKRKIIKKYINQARSATNITWRNQDTANDKKIALAMWLRTIESCQATDLLVSREMYGPAWATLRLAYECLFYSCALLNSSENAKRLGDHHMHQIAKLLKSQLRDSVKQADLSDEMKKAIAKYDDAISNHPNWTVSDAAREAEMTEQYSNVYRSISQLGAHANISSLDQHLSDMNQQLLTRGARGEDKESLINLTIECLALGMLRFPS